MIVYDFVITKIRNTGQGKQLMQNTEQVTKKKTRNKSNDYFESLQYRQDLLPIVHYQKRTHSENHNNTCAENPLFKI